MQIGAAIDELDTPCLIVDLDRMASNIQRMQMAVSAHGVKLRPHIKTHKVPEIAQMQLAAGAVGIASAKASEAEVFAAAGCNNISIPYPTVGREKWQRIARLARSSTVTVAVESELGVRGLSAAAVEEGSTIRVQVEVDIGLNRCGVRPEEAEDLCRLVVSSPGLELGGIFGYRSVFFAGAEGRSPSELGREEGELIVALAQHLRSSGIPINDVVGGSTPTAPYVAQVPGVTEVRPGTYLFGDCMMAEVGATNYDAIALSVLCTVVSRQNSDRATIDGGSKTFSPERFTGKDGRSGYARAVGIPAYLDRLSEEHGVLSLEPGANLDLGEKIALYPAHVCTTVNLSSELVGVRNGRVEKVWQVLARGKRN